MGKGKTGSIHDYLQYKNFIVGKAINEARSISVWLWLEKQSHYVCYGKKRFTIRIRAFTSMGRSGEAKV